MSKNKQKNQAQNKETPAPVKDEAAKSVKLIFEEDKTYNGVLAFEKGKVYDVSYELGWADRWIKRGGKIVEGEVEVGETPSLLETTSTPEDDSQTPGEPDKKDEEPKSSEGAEDTETKKEDDTPASEDKKEEGGEGEESGL
jgi:hypothetical protein